MKEHFALVTGASSGIGLAIAKGLAQRGYNLLIVSNVEAIYERVEELKKEGQKSKEGSIDVIALVMDLAQQGSARELYEYTKREEMEIEVLVNNAGVYHDKDILDDSEAFTGLIMNLHMYTPAMLCYLFGQEMRARRKGYIMNICSVTSRIVAQRLGTYASTKSFLAAFTKSLIIATPEMLSRRALRALFHGRSKTTIPTVFWQVLCFIIMLIPTCVLRGIRKLGWF